MSNLGLYQTITTAAKVMGGPANLLLGAGVAGYLVLRGGEILIKEIVTEVKQRKSRRTYETEQRFTVTKAYRDGHGLSLSSGDQVRVLETDEDSYLIEKIGDQNNPYFISGALLKTLVT